MVTTSCDPSGLHPGFMEFTIVARVPHDWARSRIVPLVQTGYGHITTSSKEYTQICTSDADPNFEHIISEVIKLCSAYEMAEVSKIQDKISRLERRKAMLDSERTGT